MPECVDALEPVAEAALYPEELRSAETKRLGRPPKIGFALSGGGIRSATLSLGFFQGLAKRQLAQCINVLSTVSGATAYAHAECPRAVGMPH